MASKTDQYKQDASLRIAGSYEDIRVQHGVQARIKQSVRLKEVYRHVKERFAGKLIGNIKN